MSLSRQGGNMADVFQTQQELYRRVRPALSSKAEEMRRLGYTFIKEEDVWNFLKESKWRQAEGLSLAQLVSDILNAENDPIQKYFLDRLKHVERKID